MIKLISPFRGEFGIKLMRHVPAVHAMDGRKVVVCEPGEKLLYPSAWKYFICERANDNDRRDMYDKDKHIKSLEEIAFQSAEELYDEQIEIVRTDADMPRAYFTPEPRNGMPNEHINYPWVVMCPRFRKYGSEKNWPHWNRLSWLLEQAKISPMLIGDRESSDLSVAGGNTFDHTSNVVLDATVTYMRKAKLCIATDAGLAHLAMWCGCPLLMITHGDDCRVAPGSVRLGNGTIAHQQYWPVKIDRYRAQNHMGVDLMMVPNAWHDPQIVFDYATMYLEKNN